MTQESPITELNRPPTTCLAGCLSPILAALGATYIAHRMAPWLNAWLLVFVWLIALLAWGVAIIAKFEYRQMRDRRHYLKESPLVGTGMEINVAFHDTANFATPSDIRAHLTSLWRVIEVLSNKDERLAKWYREADDVDDERLYPGYESPGVPSTTVLAMLSHQDKDKEDGSMEIELWNGQTNYFDYATVSISLDTEYLPQGCTVSLPGERDPTSRLGNYKAVAQVISAIVNTYSPAYVSVAPLEYKMEKAFKDGPGVGWMLYLPKIITAQQVPEARALIPVQGPYMKPVGTILVSVTDAIFSVDNRQHVKIARRIEKRLAKQGFLPRY